jgi:hypothetical protein
MFIIGGTATALPPLTFYAVKNFTSGGIFWLRIFCC